MTRKAVFLDRDGVLNQSVLKNGVSCPPEDAGAMTIVPVAAEAVRLLKKAGYVCICVTNQPDIARGTRSADNVQAMNDKVRAAVDLDDLFVCPHDDADNCSCRKPKPGMLLAGAKKWGVDLSASWMVGDRLSDIAAGKAAGCGTVFITGTSASGVGADFVCADVLCAARSILGLL